MNSRDMHAMNTLERSKLRSFIPVQRKLTKAIEDIGEEANVYSGMTANSQSRSLIYKPAREQSAVRDESGGSMIEFALIAPLLFVILFGIIEFSVLLFDKAMLTNASREGARAGIVYDFDSTTGTNHPDNSTITTTVQEYCQDYLISFGTGSAVSIAISRTGSASLDSAGDQLTVNVSYPFRFLVFSNILALIGGDLADDLTLEAETVMRME